MEENNQYRPTFPLSFETQRYQYQKARYETAAKPGGIDYILKSDLYITGQTVESITALIATRYDINRNIKSELRRMRYGLQDRINQTMYFGDRLSTMVKRRTDLEKQLLQLDTEAMKEQQTFWKDIAMLTKELRYKIEQYKKEKAKGYLL